MLEQCKHSRTRVRPPSPQVIGLSSGGRVAGLAVGGGGGRARARITLLSRISAPRQDIFFQFFRLQALFSILLETIVCPVCPISAGVPR